MALIKRVSEALTKAIEPVSRATDAPISHSSRSSTDPDGGARHKRDFKVIKKDDLPQAQASGQATPASTGFQRLGSVSQETKIANAATQAAMDDTEPREFHEIVAVNQLRDQKPLTPEQMSVAHRIVQLISAFQKQQGNILRWVGTRTYRVLSGESRKGKFRRGAMLDEEID